MKTRTEFALIIAIFLLLFLSNLLVRYSGITGFFLATQTYTEEINLTSEGNSTYNWNIDQNNTQLTFVRVTGSLSGNSTGYAKIYLIANNRSYLILERKINQIPEQNQSFFQVLSSFFQVRFSKASLFLIL